MYWAHEITTKPGMDAYDHWVIEQLTDETDALIEAGLTHVAAGQKAAVKDHVIEGLINMLCGLHSKHPTVIFKG